ncbi:MAG TPA: FHA domain-containing protein [Solirubrobacterales bacterium]
MQEHGEQTVEFAAPTSNDPPAWLREAREALPSAGLFLTCREEDGEIRVFPIERGWTRIGRSVAADIRLDDPSVSRRHALIVSEAPGSLRVLDDRSLNGVFLNGEVVEWGELSDGDELAIGRYRLFALEG